MELSELVVVEEVVAVEFLGSVGDAGDKSIAAGGLVVPVHKICRRVLQPYCNKYRELCNQKHSGQVRNNLDTY